MRSEKGQSKQPCAAAVVLAHAISDSRNGIVLKILSSPLMASPLSLRRRQTWSQGKLNRVDRATALDHARHRLSRNIVAVGLLTKNYVCSWKRWEAVLSTCDSLAEPIRDHQPRKGHWSTCRALSGRHRPPF